ncbi:hypothetical protein MN116_002793 [Schistosoma mekongi]|uniref:C2H2-type domain-containing protein n=1 Tax=Schistosoma mekongi TaxID=38744 RepID=A0AAE1ZHN7_SCHME|nr:hypothetical protein MN116_002793 [Schistosoma mekongi]
MPNPREYIGATSGSRRGRRSYPKAETLNKGLNCEPIIFHREYTKRILPQSSRGKPRGKAGRPRKYKVAISRNYQDSPSIPETLDSFNRSPSLSSDKTSSKRQRRLSKDNSSAVPRFANQKSDTSIIKVKSDESLYKLSTSQSSEVSLEDPAVNIKNFTCHECGMQFKTKGRFNKHMPCRVHRNSECLQKPHLKRGRKSLNSRSLNNIKLSSCTIQQKSIDRMDETSLLVRVVGKAPKSGNFTTYLDDELKEANSENFLSRKPSVTGILKFHLSPNRTIELLVCANKLAVKRCISAVGTNSFTDCKLSPPFDKMYNCNTNEYLMDVNSASSLPFTCSSFYRSSDSVLISSSSLSSVNSGKENQEVYTNLTTVCQKDCMFNTHDINMSSNSLEYNYRSQDELQAARTILSLARGSTDDMALNMGQIMTELDNMPKINNLCTARNISHADISSAIIEPKIQGDKACEHPHWMSKQDDGINTVTDKTLHNVLSTTHSTEPINNVNAFSNNLFHDTILNDLTKCVSHHNLTTTSISTNTSVPVIHSTDNLIAIQPTKLPTHCTTDSWPPVTSSQNNNSNTSVGNNNVLQRKIRPPPKKRLSTNYARSNSSRSLTDNTNATSKLQDNVNQTKISSPSSSNGCEQLTVSQSIKHVINLSPSSSSVSTAEHVDRLPSFPSSGIGLLPTPIQFTNVIYGNPSLISSQSTPLTSYISNTDHNSHQSNPMNGFAMVFPSPRPITPTPPTISGSQPSPSFFILPQLMVLPRFIGSYIPMITAPEPYPSTVNPIQSTNLMETRPSTFMTSSLVTPIPTVQPEFSAVSQPIKTIILQPPSTSLFSVDNMNTIVPQTPEDSQSINNNNNMHDDGSDSNLLSLQQSDTSLNNSVKDKLLLPTVFSTPSSPNYSKKLDNAKCVWSSGFNATKPIPIRPVPDVSKTKSNSVFSNAQNTSLQDQQQYYTVLGQNGSDQKMLPILVTSHDLTNSFTKSNPTLTATTFPVTSTTVNNIIPSSYVSSTSPSPSSNLISPTKTVSIEVPTDTKQSRPDKLVTILPANQSDKIKFPYRPIYHCHKRRINFTRRNTHKKCLLNSFTLQRSNTFLRGRYGCQDSSSSHTTKSYHHLKRHWHAHLSNRPYICHHCDISFKTSGNLSKHMKSRCHHDRFLRDSGLSHVSLAGSSSVIKQDFEQQSKDEPNDLAVGNDDNSVSEDHQSCFKSSTVSSTLSSSSLSCKTRNSTGAINNRSSHFGNKGNQVKSPCTNFYEIISKTSPSSIALSSSSLVPTTISLKTSVLQSNISSSHIVDSSSRIPAPNVNAVNLSQDLPMNLSAKPQEPIALIRYIVEPTVYTKINGIQPNCLSHSDNLCDKKVSNNCLSSAEVIVQSAVEAARNLATDKTNFKQMVDKSSYHSTLDSKNFETISTPENLSDHAKQVTDSQMINFSISDCEEQQHFTRGGMPTSTPSHQEKNCQHDKSCLLPNSTSSNNSSCSTTCTGDTSSGKLNKDMKQNSGKSPHTSVSGALNKSDTRQSHGVRSHTCLKDPRPYKCNMCHVGFRVSGHLCKHYRSKSHMLNILQMAQLSNSTIERVLQSHMGNLQLINPDTGELSMRILEKIIPACEFPSVTTVSSGVNGHN